MAAADRPPAAAAMKAETAAPVAAPAGAHGTASGATPPATPDAAAKPAAPAKPPGRILLAVTPWGEVLVDGRKRGLAPPLSELRVPPGKHTVEVRNSTFPPYTETVDVPPGGDVRIRHKFQ